MTTDTILNSSIFKFKLCNAKKETLNYFRDLYIAHILFAYFCSETTSHPLHKTLHVAITYTVVEYFMQQHHELNLINKINEHI